MISVKTPLHLYQIKVKDMKLLGAWLTIKFEIKYRQKILQIIIL